MSHAHSKAVAERLIQDYLTKPERWERCPVDRCNNWRKGVLCGSHWELSPKTLRDPINATKDQRGSEANEQAVKEIIEWWNNRPQRTKRS